MRRTTMGLVLANLFLPSVLPAQAPPDTSLQAILAVLNGADPKLLHERRGQREGDNLVRGFLTDVLAQYIGPELGTRRAGGSRSQAELDAFAEELVSLALATTPPESWVEATDPVARRIINAIFVAGKRGPDTDHTPYSGSYDALLRLYEAGIAKPWDLIDFDPARGVEYMLDHFQAGRLDQLQACQVLRMAYKYGKVVAEDDGTLSFKPGGLHSSRLMADVFKEIRGERFVENDIPHLTPCYWVRAGRREG